MCVVKSKPFMVLHIICLSSPRLRLVFSGFSYGDTQLNSQHRYYLTTSHLASLPRYTTASTHLKDGKTGTRIGTIIHFIHYCTNN